VKFVGIKFILKMNGIKEISYKSLLTEVNQIITATKASRDEKLQKICNLLADEIDVFDWVGFYLVHSDKERELVLGPFCGEETEHTHIAFGEGICGQSAATNETFVVQDVSEEDNYLSCSANVRAEIVAPVMKGDNFVAELDIDSHTRDSISDELRQLTEEICERIAKIF